MTSRRSVCVMVLMLITIHFSTSADNGTFNFKVDNEKEKTNFPFTGTRGATTYVNENASTISIGNDFIELEFNKFTGAGLDRIIDKSTGLDLRGNKVPPAMMFMFLYWTGMATDIMIQWDAQGFEITNESGSDFSRININYTNLKSYNLNASVSVTLRDNESMADFRMNITNHEPFVIKSVFFPLVWGLGQIGSNASDDEVFYPSGDGIVIRNPLSYTDELHMTALYPSTASMQIMCHYDPLEAGLYLATYDTQGHPKKPSMDWMEWAAVKHFAGFFEHLIPEYPGNNFSMNYNAVVGTFHGNWYDAAEIYSQWAHTTPFVVEGEVFEDKDTPLWFGNTSVVSSANRDADFIHTPLSEIVNITGEFNNLTGANTTHLIFAWAQNGGWVGPYYFPPAAGEGNFTNATEDIRELGGHAFLYISGSVWRVTREEIGYADYELFNSTGLPWVCINETGGPTFDTGYESIGWHSARMDPMTDFWHDMVVNNTLDCIRLGVDVVQIDEFPIGSIYPCYNASHGHPLGYSRDISKAYLSIIQDAKVQGRLLNPDFILSMEEPSEFYIQYMDTYVSRDNAPEFLLYPFAVESFGDDIQFVPFFGQVYHEYITAFGEPIPMNYDYPEPFLDQMKRSLARCFVSGEIISGSADEMVNLRPEVKELYNRTVRATTIYAKEYLLEGRPLEPPEISVPKKEINWYFYSINRSGRPFNESTVLNSAWESDNGDIGYVFVNWNDTAIEFNVDLLSYDLPYGNYSVYITRNGERNILFRETQLPRTINLSMDSLDVVLVEVVRIADLAISNSDLELETGSPLTDDGYTLNLTIYNTGTGQTGPFEVGFYQNGSLIGSTQVPNLEVDEGTREGIIWDTTGLLGDYNLSAVVDIADVVWELSEDNNTAAIQVTVLPRPTSNLTVWALDNDTNEPLLFAQAVLRLHGDPNPLAINYSEMGETIKFYQLESGNYDVSVSALNYITGSLTFYLAEGVDEWLTLRLDPVIFPSDIYGSVFDNSTRFGIPGAEASLFFYENGTLLAIEITNANGEFDFNNIMEGNYTILVEKEGYFYNSKNISLNGSALTFTFEFWLDPIPPPPPTEGDIFGIVKDADTEDGIPGTNVTFVTFSMFTQTDAYGEYEFTNISEGTYRINISHPDYVSQEENITIIPGKSVYLNFTLFQKEESTLPQPKLAILSGNVTDKEGHPVKAAFIKDSLNNTLAITNNQGYFQIVDLEPGTYIFKVVSKDFITAFTHEIVLEEGDTEDIVVILEYDVKLKDDGEDGGTTGLIAILLIILVLIVITIVLLILKRKEQDKGPTLKDEEPIPESAINGENKGEIT